MLVNSFTGVSREELMDVSAKGLDALEKAQLLEKTGEKKIRNKGGKDVMLYSGRKLTAKGRKLLDSVAKEVRVG